MCQALPGFGTSPCHICFMYRVDRSNVRFTFWVPEQNWIHWGNTILEWKEYMDMWKKLKIRHIHMHIYVYIYICIYIYRSIRISAYHRALQEKIHINIPIYLLQESDTAKPCKTLGFSFPNLPISVGFQPPDARPARPGSEVPRQTPLESTSLAITNRLLSSFRTQKHCIKNA